MPPRDVPSLVGPEGFFHANDFLRLLRQGAINPDELEAEFDAQISRVKDVAGTRLTHLDSQGNSHVCYLDLFLVLARKWGVHRMRNNASMICLKRLDPDGCAPRCI